MNLTLFDLDNTLLAGDSDFAWAQFLISRGVLDREVYEARNLSFYEQYKAGTLDIFEFLEFQLAPLARHPRAQLDGWHQEFMATCIQPMITDPARVLVDRHVAAGDLVAVVTRSPAATCRSTSTRAGSVIMGWMQVAMNSWCQPSNCARGWRARGASWNSRNSKMSRVPALYCS